MCSCDFAPASVLVRVCCALASILPCTGSHALTPLATHGLWCILPCMCSHAPCSACALVCLSDKSNEFTRGTLCNSFEQNTQELWFRASRRLEKVGRRLTKMGSRLPHGFSAFNFKQGLSPTCLRVPRIFDSCLRGQGKHGWTLLLVGADYSVVWLTYPL